MVTVITRVALREGGAAEWDTAMRERLGAARGRRGWLGGQLLMPLDSPDERLIVGTWETREDWEAWHTDEAFRETRERLDELHAERTEITWLEVLADVRGTD